MLAVDQLDADGAEPVQVVVPRGLAGCAAFMRGKMIMGTVATHSQSTVSAWLLAMPSASLATLLAVIGAPTKTWLLG